MYINSSLGRLVTGASLPFLFYSCNLIISALQCTHHKITGGFNMEHILMCMTALVVIEAFKVLLILYLSISKDINKLLEKLLENK